METFLDYIIEAGLSLGIFTLVYWFFLRKETMLNASRIYLLVAVIFSTLLPFIEIDLQAITSPSQSIAANNDEIALSNVLETVTVYASGIPERISAAVLSIKPTLVLYFMGVLFAFIAIVTGLFHLASMVSKNRIFKLRNARLVVSPKVESPYSFFHYIFIGNDLLQKENWKTMIHHEMEHVKQGHSFDVLFIDLMMVFQWFNPFYWIIRQLVRENHEFLADRAVLHSGTITVAGYKALLLSQSVGGHLVITSNFFNVKTIKKRFKMITKNKTNNISGIKYTTGVAIAVVLTMMFAVNTSAVNFQSGSEPMNAPSIEKLETVAELPVVKDETKPDKKEGKTIYIYKAEIIEAKKLKDIMKDEHVLMELNKEHAASMLHKKIEEIEEAKYMLVVDAEQMRMKKWAGQDSEARNDTSKSDVYVMVEDMPEFPGGEIELRKWIASNIKYPARAAEAGIQGKVYIQFVVEKDGSIGRARVARGVDSLLNMEAMRVVNAMPKWKPGKQRGAEVAVSYTVPINFQLQGPNSGRTIEEKLVAVTGYNNNDVIKADSIYETCDVMPEYPGGMDAMRRFIAVNIKYPHEALKYGEVGKVFVSFVVAKDGAVEKVRIVRNVTPALDNEAIRVVSNMPNWKPGTNKGEPVNVRYTIPVMFTLQ